MKLISLISASLVSLTAVSAAASSTSSVKELYKAVMLNLPKSCDEVKSSGQFDIKKAESYNCMFDETVERDVSKFSRNNVKYVMVFLMQAGEKTLVECIANNWVKHSDWSPYNPLLIKSDLESILDVGGRESFSFQSNITSKKSKKSKKSMKSSDASVEIEPKAVYDTFILLLNLAKRNIPSNQASFAKIIYKILNFAVKKDKTAQDQRNTVELVIETFLQIKKENIPEKIQSETFVVVDKLNRWALSGKIQKEAWNVYSPVICEYINENFKSEYEIIKFDKLTKKIHDESAEANGSTKTEDSFIKMIGVQKKTKTPIINENIPKINENITIINDDIPKSIITKNQSSAFNTLFQNDNNIGLTILVAGSVLLLSILGYMVHLIIKKRNESSDY